MTRQTVRPKNGSIDKNNVDTHKNVGVYVVIGANYSSQPLPGPYIRSRKV